MTTTILVAIGILLAALAALMLLFFGGSAFGQSHTQAEAARLVGEGAQITYATDLFYRQEDRLPGEGVTLQKDPDTGTTETTGHAALRELIEKKYLTYVPKGALLTDTDSWQMNYDGSGMIYTTLGQSSDKAAMDVCREARKQLALADATTSSKVYKCDGSDYSPDTRWASAGTLPDREPCCVR